MLSYDITEKIVSVMWHFQKHWSNYHTLAVVHISKEAYCSVNTILSQRNWLIGYRIAEEELAGEERAEYGVLIDLKTERITHQDVGQMDMYIGCMMN